MTSALCNLEQLRDTVAVRCYGWWKRAGYGVVDQWVLKLRLGITSPGLLLHSSMTIAKEVYYIFSKLELLFTM